MEATYYGDVGCNEMVREVADLAHPRGVDFIVELGWHFVAGGAAP